uniref:Uncharacterized protein n=1 Tax=Lepisosteus oculatus TaxID=7918 RepID=W5NLN4_LEPOC
GKGTKVKCTFEQSPLVTRDPLVSLSRYPSFSESDGLCAHTPPPPPQRRQDSDRFAGGYFSLPQ